MRIIIFFTLIICSFLSLSLRAQPKPHELDSMLKALPSMPDDTNKVLLYCKLSSHYFRLENPEACLAFFYKATALAEKLNFWKGMAIAYNTKGSMYGIYNDNTQMIKDFLIAEEYYNKINSKSGLAETFVNIGGVYHKIEKDSLALSYLQKAKEIREAIKDSAGLAIVMIAQGIIYDKLKKPEKSINLYHEAETIFKVLGNQRGLMNLYYNLGYLYKSQKSYEQAKLACSKCYELAKASNSPRYVANSLSCITEAEISLGQLAEAKKSVEDLLAYIPSVEDLSSVKDAYHIISRYYEDVRDIEKALKYSRKERDFLDSLYSKEKERQKDWVNAITRLKEKETETKTLSLQQKQKDATISQQQITVYIAIAALLIIAISLYFQLKSNKKLQKAYKKLDLQQEEISNKNLALEKTNATKDQLFSIVSHDLMSPVNALSGILELLKMNAISEEELPAFVEEASVEVENTTTFLRNLLFWARSQMDGFSIKKETLPFCALVQENVELLKPQLRKKNLVLNNLCEQKQLVLADKELLNTVIRNLLSNAIKFSRDGGIIDISSRQTGDFLEVTVKDNGVGIPAAAQAKIWSDLLYSTRGTQNEKGTGVGLALCKNFTEKNGGTIRFESEEGKGTAFYFTLPLVAS